MEKSFSRTLDILNVSAVVVDMVKREFLNLKYEIVGIDRDDSTGIKAYIERHNPDKIVGEVKIDSVETVKYSCTLEDFLKVAKRTNK